MSRTSSSAPVGACVKAGETFTRSRSANAVLRRLAAAVGAIGLVAAAPLAGQARVAEVMLRPPTSAVFLKSPGSQWRRAVQLEGLRHGDSVRVQSGSAEVVFTSGERTTVSAGGKAAVSVPSEQSRSGVLAYVGAAVRAMLDLTRGDAVQRTLSRESLEAPTARQQGVVRPGSVGGGMVLMRGNRSARGDSPRDQARRLRAPVRPSSWSVLPGEPTIRWDWTLVPARSAGPARIRIYPATGAAGCPVGGAAVVDVVAPNSRSLRRALRARLVPGLEYRIEAKRGESLDVGCIRVASREQEASIQAGLRALRAEYRRAGLPGADGTLPMLEAALLARGGYHADALLRLEPVLLAPHPPATAVQLWRAIAMQAQPSPALR